MNWAILAVVVAALIAAGVVAWMYMQKQSKQLRSRYGSEYDRAVQETGNRRSAEKMLKEREQRVEQLRIRPLVPEDRERFQREWESIQVRFVDDPKTAIIEGDRLVERVMRARGYPLADFEQQAADVSVEHPHVVKNYRAAHDIAQRARQTDQTNTETLRQGLVYYRQLFEELLQAHEPILEEVKR
jgi:hypothetical protein